MRTKQESTWDLDLGVLCLAIVFGMAIFYGISFVSAETEYYKVGVSNNFQFTCTLNNAIPSPSTTYNISLFTPKGIRLLNNQPTQSQGSGSFNYTYNFTETGLYKVKMFCTDGTYSFSDEGFYQVTGNGEPLPSGNIIIVFSIAFLVIMFFLVWELIMSVGHFMNLDFDIEDLSKAWGTYFALFALYWLETLYLGNVEMERWLLLFLKTGAITHFLVPLIAFVISLTIGGLKKQSFDVGMKHFKRTKLDRMGIK